MNPRPLISVIMPYWRRGDALVDTLRSYTEAYRGTAQGMIEVVIADDGSPDDVAAAALQSFEATDEAAPFEIRLVELPQKDGPKNPCVPINRAVAVAGGDLLLLTSPEVRHPRPILWQAVAELERLGPLGVVVCAVLDTGTGRWYSHSVHAPARYHFCNLLRRSLFEAAGGFDEEYRDGYCWDDPDFVRRLERAGAQFLHRDDLVAEHHRVARDDKGTIPRALWDRNKALFLAKWSALPVTW